MPQKIKKLEKFKKLVLTDAVLLGEIPSPTFNEENRIRLAVDRFRENELESREIDESENASAVIQVLRGVRPF